MTDQHNDDDAGAAAAAEDLDGELRSQTGPRTVAPMWPRPLLTDGEWAVYTALWSFGNWNGMDAIPKHQTLADRAWCERGSAINAVRKFQDLGLLVRRPRTRKDGSQTSNLYVLVEVCPDDLAAKIVEATEVRMAEQAVKKAKRDADKRKYRKKAGLPAETTPSDDDAEAGNGGGSLHSDPPSAGLPDWAQDKGGSSGSDPRGSLPDDPRGSLPNGPVTYPGFDLPPIDQSPPTAVATHAADAHEAEPAANAAASEAPPAVEGKTFDPTTKTKLTSAVDAAVAARRQRTGWARPVVVAEVTAALDAGYPVDDVVATLAEIATDLDGTDYPSRLVPYLAAKARKASASSPATAYRHEHLPRDVRRCPIHPDQPAATCDLEGHPDPTVTAKAAAAAKAAARAMLRPGKPLSPVSAAAARARAEAAAQAAQEKADVPAQEHASRPAADLWGVAAPPTAGEAQNAAHAA